MFVKLWKSSISSVLGHMQSLLFNTTLLQLSVILQEVGS